MTCNAPKLLETARQIGARLIVMGSGPLAQPLREKANALGVATRVSWHDPVPQATLQKYYAAADLTVLTSLREGMPNVVLESLACGTPVVSMAVGGANEVLTDPVAGRLVHGRSADSFAAACRDVLAAPPTVVDVRRFGERFGWRAFNHGPWCAGRRARATEMRPNS